MAIQNITYDNKTALNQNNDIPNINKVTANDMNEIKSVVNNNASELNALTGILQPYLLYNDSTGNNNSVTLSETSANYTYMDIIYRTSDNCYSSVKVYQPDGKRISMVGQYCTSSQVSWKLAVWDISGTTLSCVSSSEIEMTNSNSINGYRNIYVTQVVGWK